MQGRTRKSMTHVIERIVSTSPEHDALAKPSPAHRLDKATGGVVTFVKTLRAAQGMENSFAKSRSVFKRCVLDAALSLVLSILPITGSIHPPQLPGSVLRGWAITSNCWGKHLENR